MSKFPIGFLRASVLSAAVMMTAAGPLHAAPQDYRFELAQPQVKAGNSAQFAVRLIHVPTGKPIENAVILQTRLDMSPMGMGDMTVRATPMKGEEPGLYRFQAPLGMEGEWSFQLAAKVPGETDTVRGAVKLKTTK